MELVGGYRTEINNSCFSFCWPFLPLFTAYLHKPEIESISNRLPILREAAFFEASPGSGVPIQGFQVDSLEVCLVENIVEQSGCSLSAVAFTPVVRVTNHNAQFGLTISFIDVVISAIADVLAVQGFYSEFAPGW